jgi:hypothetical protein
VAIDRVPEIFPENIQPCRVAKPGRENQNFKSNNFYFADLILLMR